METRNKIKTILDKLEIKEPPIPLEKITTFFGLAVINYPKFPDSVSGTIIKDDDLLAIGVNDNHAKVRQRFTIAHELGHYILGHDVDKILDDEFDKSSDKEKEANSFAGELLIPHHMLESDLKNQIWTIKDLSQRYQVSEQVVTIKLLESNLINNKNLK
ncbi:MAG: ImmA/IrrE family metallo-endopeptidase [Candidatus Komeilibacteria bacterium]|nr:ImmA/IrrE family metallo-endopeptidase [Candidatus Komeilibacteria bacterium]